jgi:hypothetical protein
MATLYTAGGITSGIDFGLEILADLLGKEEAKTVQLALEYAPAPPFSSGTPEDAAPEYHRRSTAAHGALPPGTAGPASVRTGLKPLLPPPNDLQRSVDFAVPDLIQDLHPSELVLALGRNINGSYHNVPPNHNSLLRADNPVHQTRSQDIQSDSLHILRVLLAVE